MSVEANVPDSELVLEISSILHVANDLYATYPHIAYLCFHGALKQALKLDTVAGEGVGQFMTSVISWIERDDKTIRKGLLRHRDRPKLQNFYIEYYVKNFPATKPGTNETTEGHDGSSASAPTHPPAPSPAPDPAPEDSSQLKKACQTAVVLYKVLEALWPDEQLPPQITEAHTEVKKLAQSFVTIPLDHNSLVEAVPDSELVPSSLAEISSTLRVANEVQPNNIRIAFICVHGALEQAFRLDRIARGHGVLEFMISLRSWLNRNNKLTREVSHRKDLEEMQYFYSIYYMENIHPDSIVDSSQLAKACQTALILYKVMKVLWTDDMTDDAHRKYSRANTKVEKLAQIYKPYNIIPLDPLSDNHAIRGFIEIRAVITALHDTTGLQRRKNGDILDWLQAIFGFQKDNVSNQREHLILLLANVQSRMLPKEEQPRLKDGALKKVMENLLENYKSWYKFLDRKDSKWLPNIEKDKEQRKLIYIGLYLLIWGEAANIRFMPECLCYIYHHMANDLFKMLNRTETGEPVKSAYGDGDEAFLKEVVTPIYKTIYKEKENGKGGKHSKGRNYDDLNEYFWYNANAS